MSLQVYGPLTGQRVDKEIALLIYKRSTCLKETEMEVVGRWVEGRETCRRKNVCERKKGRE